MFAFLFGIERVPAMRTSKFQRRKAIVLWRKFGIADFTKNLTFRTIVFIEKWFRCITARTGTMLGNIAFGTSMNGLNFLTIAFFIVRKKVFVIPTLSKISEERKLVYFVFLIAWRVRVIKCPLFEREISTNKLK